MSKLATCPHCGGDLAGRHEHNGGLRMADQDRRHRDRMGWANAHAIADQHSMEVLHIYARAQADMARALARKRGQAHENR
jgi:hypothetical protein